MKVDVGGGTRLYIDIDGVGIAAESDHMRERPTLLLLHGGPGLDHSSLKRELSGLRDLAQLVYIDHRGNGRSDRATPDSWNLAQWGDDIRALCDVLGIERPVVMGQSFGGFVAQSYAVRHPGHAAGIILSSTSPRFTRERNLAVFQRVGGSEAHAAAVAFYQDPTPATLGPFIEKCMPTYNTRFSDPNGMARSILNMDVLLHFFAHEYRTWNILPELPKIECPVLVMGGEQDPTTPIEDQADIAAAIRPDLVSFHRFDDCGHGAYRDCPDDAIPIIREFVARVGTFA